MNARSWLFDVYGDHLRQRGGAAPVAALVRLLQTLDVAPPAVRTAISRMVRQGWLEPRRVADSPGYALTTRGAARLESAHRRVYRTGPQEWDGTWRLLTIAHIPERAERQRLREALVFHGYGPLTGRTWVSPRDADDLDAVLAGVDHHRFVARHQGEGLALMAQAWDLPEIARAYREWQTGAEVLLAGLDLAGATGHDDQDFALRSHLVHGWRKFLFRDPGLPAELLPADWPARLAAQRFDEAAGRLRPGADRHVDACLAAAGFVDDQLTEDLEA